MKECATNNWKKYSECLKDPKCIEMYSSKKGSSNVSQQQVEVDLDLIKVNLSRIVNVNKMLIIRNLQNLKIYLWDAKLEDVIVRYKF